MKTLLVDSSVFVAALLSSDSHHKTSQQFFASLRKKEKQVFLVVPATIIFEVANVLTRLGKIEAARALPRYFPTLQTIPVDDSFVSQAIPLLPRVRLNP